MKRLLSYRLDNIQGQGKRDYQEDSFAFVNALDVTLIKEEGLLAVVADGMGGMEGGELASRTVIKTMVETFKNMDRSEKISAQLRTGVLQANDEVNGLLNGAGGSTVIAGIFFQEKFYYISVGDSYIFLMRNRELIRMNRSDNVKTDIFIKTIQLGEIDPAPGRGNEEAEALMQFIGKGGDIEPDVLISPYSLKDGDMVVFCTDGIGDILSEEEMLYCLINNTPEQACRNMGRMIQERNVPNQDNYTALVVQCGY